MSNICSISMKVNSCNGFLANLWTPAMRRRLSPGRVLTAQLIQLVIAMLAVGVGAVITHMWLLMVGIMLAVMAMVMTLRQRSVRPRI